MMETKSVVREVDEVHPLSERACVRRSLCGNGWGRNCGYGRNTV